MVHCDKIADKFEMISYAIGYIERHLARTSLISD